MLRRLPDRLTYANVAATLVLFISLGGASYAAATAPANSVGTPLALPTFVAGPVLSGGTLIWQDSAGLEALSPGGAPHSLLRGGTLSEVSTGGGRIAIDARHALLAGQANGKLEPVKLPRSCLPLTAAKPPQAFKGGSLLAAHALFAISGSRLLIVVGPACTIGPRDHGAATRVMTLHVRGRQVELVRRLSRRPLAVALAGSTVALFDSITSRGVATITVLRPRARAIAGRTVSMRTWPIVDKRIITTNVQIDDAGDVLATNLSRGPGPFGGTGVSGVVFPADGKAFKPELQTNGPFSGLSIPARPLVALSDGRLAFFNSTEKIEVVDITTGTPLATIDIAPDNNVLGIALEGSNLTWIQQPVAHVLGPPTTNSSLPTCSFGTSPTGPAIVEHENLTDLGSTPITVGSSPTPVACTERSPPP